MTAARRLRDSPDEVVGWEEPRRVPVVSGSPSAELQEELEARESAEFVSLMGGNGVFEEYYSLAKEPAASVPYDWTPRAWKLEAKTDAFVPLEVLSSYRATERVCSLPLWQQELYSTDQPGRNSTFSWCMGVE